MATPWTETTQLHWEDGLVIRCPRCGTPAGKWCMDGKEKAYHQARINLIVELREDCRLGMGEHYWQRVAQVNALCRRVYQESFAEPSRRRGRLRLSSATASFLIATVILMIGVYFIEPAMPIAQRVAFIGGLWLLWKASGV
jgi:hypothetical protein